MLFCHLKRLINMGGRLLLIAVPFLAKRPVFWIALKHTLVFSMDNNEKRLESGILKAIEFEMLYLKNKCEFYERMANEDRVRLDLFTQRFNAAKSKNIY